MLRVLHPDYNAWLPPADPGRTVRWRQPGGRSGAWELECLGQQGERWVPEVAGWAPDLATVLPDHYGRVHRCLARQQGTELVGGRWWFPRRGKYDVLHRALQRHFRHKRPLSTVVMAFLFGTAVWERHGEAAPERARQLKQFLRQKRRHMQLELLALALRRGLSLDKLVSGGVILVVSDEQELRCEWLQHKHRHRRPSDRCVPVHYRCVDGELSRSYMWLQWCTVARPEGVSKAQLQQCLHGYHSTELLCRQVAALKACLEEVSVATLCDLLRYRSMLRVWRCGTIEVVPDDGSAAGIRAYLACCSPSARWLLQVLGMILVSVEPAVPGRWLGKKCSCMEVSMELGGHQDCTFLESNEFGARCALRHHPRMVALRDFLEFAPTEVVQEFPLLTHRRE
jgi:hypothetical protein